MADWLRPSAICAPRKLLCSTTARKTASERRSDWASCIPCPYISFVDINPIIFLFYCALVHAFSSPAIVDQGERNHETHAELESPSIGRSACSRSLRTCRKRRGLARKDQG